MRDEGSYKIQSIGQSVETEVNRLGAQVDLFWDKELKRYKEFGLRDSMSIVEFGSGPGYLTKKLLHSFPNCNVTAVEIDPYLIELASKYLCTENQNRYSLVQGSIMQTNFSGNTFDCAIIRLVLEHLPDPFTALREVFRVINNGGLVMCIDNDFSIHIETYPYISELRELYDAYCQARYDEGGNPRIGRELPLLLNAVGFSNVDIEVIPAHSGIIGDEIFFKSEGLGIPNKLVKDGYILSKILGQISVKWRNMLKDENHAIYRQLFIAAGQKTI